MTARSVNQGQERRKGNVVTFLLPDLPPSSNETHTIGRANIHTNKATIEIKTEWKLWRSSMQKYVKCLRIAEGSLVHIDFWFFYNFYYKNGRLRKFDTPNLVDFAINTIKMKQQWDDNVVKSYGVNSSHDPDRPRVAVRLMEIPKPEISKDRSGLILAGGQVK